MCNRLRRTLGLWLTVCFLSACFAFPPERATAQQSARVNRALLVGVDDFVSRPSTFPSSTNNVFAMQEALQACNAPFETIVIPEAQVTDAPSLADLISQTFGCADEDDVSYLYISTHGEYDPDNGVEASLLLSDGVTEGRLTPAELQAAFDGVAGTKVIILDACYSGAFIGKGMRSQPERLYFQGDDFKVLTSSGAMEESWYWNAAVDASAAENTSGSYQQGAFYFTQALSQSLSPRCGFSADTNRDGSVTLSELYDTLLENHAASTPQVYPQEDDFVVFTYDPQEAKLDASERSPIGDVTFSGTTLSEADRRLTIEYVATRPVRVAYQIVSRRDGKWRFDEAQLLYDDVEQYTAFGDEQGAVTAGRKVRSLSLNLQDGQTSGYMLVQVVSIDNGKLTVHAGRVIAIPPAQGELELAVETAERFETGGARELAIFIRHAFPCQLSVSIVDQDGDTVYRLCHRQSTRPLQITPEGSTFYWNGRDRDGNLVNAGKYCVRVTGYIGEQTETVTSNTSTLSPRQPGCRLRPSLETD